MAVQHINKKSENKKPQLFDGIPPNVAIELLKQCELVKLEPEAVLLSPEIDNNHLYYLSKGKLSLRLHNMKIPPLDIFIPGECAGEVSYLDGMRPSAFVIADESSEVYKIDEATLSKLMESSQRIAINLTWILTSRIRNGLLTINDTFSNLIENERHANIDALTGLHNRRWFDDMFYREHERCQRDSIPACMLMVDIDFFKKYNDDNGHLAGDRCLCVVADVLRESLRPADMIVRFGGEEFVIFLPDTSKEIGIDIAERLCRSVAESKITHTLHNELPSITVSTGLAELGVEQTLESLLKAADDALYEAKAAGRNQVVHKP